MKKNWGKVNGVWKRVKVIRNLQERAEVGKAGREEQNKQVRLARLLLQGRQFSSDLKGESAGWAERAAVWVDKCWTVTMPAHGRWKKNALKHLFLCLLLFPFCAPACHGCYWPRMESLSAELKDLSISLGQGRCSWAGRVQIPSPIINTSLKSPAERQRYPRERSITPSTIMMPHYWLNCLFITAVWHFGACLKKYNDRKSALRFWSWEQIAHSHVSFISPQAFSSFIVSQPRSYSLAFFSLDVMGRLASPFRLMWCLGHSEIWQLKLYHLRLNINFPVTGKRQVSFFSFCLFC